MIVQVKNVIPTTKKILEIHIVEGWPGFGGIGGQQPSVELQETEKETGEKRSDSHCRGQWGGQNYYNSSHKSEPALHISKIRALLT